MTPEWFDDLAKRCGEAARYAFEDDEPSMARDFRLAQQDAEDFAYSARKYFAGLQAAEPTPAPTEITPKKSRRSSRDRRVA